MKLIQQLHLIAIKGNPGVSSNKINRDVAERIYRKNHKIKQSINQAEPG